MTWILHEKGVPRTENEINIDTDNNGKLYVEWSSSRPHGVAKRLYQHFQDLPVGTPNSNSIFIFEDVVPAVTRVIRITLTSPLTVGKQFSVGGLTLVEGVDYDFDDTVASIFGLITAGLGLIPAAAGTDNGDSTYDLTFDPGTDANAIAFSDNDSEIAIAELVAGVDEIKTFKRCSAADIQAA